MKLVFRLVAICAVTIAYKSDGLHFSCIFLSSAIKKKLPVIFNLFYVQHNDNSLIIKRYNSGIDASQTKFFTILLGSNFVGICFGSSPKENSLHCNAVVGEDLSIQKSFGTDIVLINPLRICA